MPRAAVMTAPHEPIEVRDLPVPVLEPGAVLLETIFSEVCGTDVHLHHGQLAEVPYPIIPGHVSVGRVAEVAGQAADLEGRPVAVGDVVTFHDVHETCHACWYCQVANTPNRCEKRRVYGITYGIDTPFRGGWGEVIHLPAGVKILPIPESVPAERVIAAGCGLATAIHAVDRAGLRIGDAVVVQGSGPVGLAASILARLSGADPVIVIGDPASRLATAADFGADATLSVSLASPEERETEVRERTGGRGADVVIEATGVPAAVREGLRLARDGGRYVIAGHYTDAGEVAINPQADINRKHLEIRGTWGAEFNHFYRMIGVLERHGDLGWERLVSKHFGLDEMNEALEAVAGGRVVKAVVKP